MQKGLLTRYTIHEIIILLKNSFEKIDDESNDLRKRVILGYIEERGLKLLEQSVSPQPIVEKLCPNCGEPLDDHSDEELEKCHELLYSLTDSQKEYPKQSDAYVQFVFAEEEDESVH